jgi:hypothetical protein
VCIDVKELVSTSYESPTDNSTNKNKRKEDKKDDENAKQMIKKKKTRSTAKKTLNILDFFLSQKILFFHLCIFLLSSDFSYERLY